MNLANGKLCYIALFVYFVYGFRSEQGILCINPLAPEIFFFNFSTPCIENVNNTGTKQVSIMKQTAIWREKNGEYRACQNIQCIYLLNKYIKRNVWRLAVRYDPYMGR